MWQRSVKYIVSFNEDALCNFFEDQLFEKAFFNFFFQFLQNIFFKFGVVIFMDSQTSYGIIPFHKLDPGNFFYYFTSYQMFSNFSSLCYTKRK